MSFAPVDLMRELSSAIKDPLNRFYVLCTLDGDRSLKFSFDDVPLVAYKSPKGGLYVVTQGYWAYTTKYMDCSRDLAEGVERSSDPSDYFSHIHDVRLLPWPSKICGFFIHFVQDREDLSGVSALFDGAPADA